MVGELELSRELDELQERRDADLSLNNGVNLPEYEDALKRKRKEIELDRQATNMLSDGVQHIINPETARYNLAQREAELKQAEQELRRIQRSKRKLSKLLQMPELRLDAHVHVVSNPRNHLINWIREPRGRTLQSLLNQMEKSRINAIALTNAGGDKLYERYISQTDDLPRDYWTYTDQYAAQILPQNHEPFLLLKAEELFTPEGHMLLLGTKFGEMFQREGAHLQEILQAIKDRKEMTRIADHPFYRSGLGAKGNLEKFEHEIQAGEENSLANKIANQKARAWAIEHRKPLLANSDAHILSNIGNGYNRFAQSVLDYGSGFDLLRSLNEAIRDKRFTSVFRQSGPWEKAHHAAMVLSDHYLGLSRWACAPDGFDLEQAKEIFE